MERLSLTQLEMRGHFVHRHIGSNPEQINAMLSELGLTQLDDLIGQAMPADILNHEPLKLTETMSEQAVIEYLRKMRSRNKVFTSMIGMGYYGTVMPAVIKRNILENPSWYTAYTPYQAEVSQGRLEALLNYQQMVMDLTGMSLANASLLDEATAAAEAMTMARRLSANKSHCVIVDEDCHPQTIAVIETRAHYLGYQVIVTNPYDNLAQYDFFALIVQYPHSKGEVCDLTDITAIAHSKNALVTVASDLLSLVLLKAPAAFGVDIVVGNSQRFGVPMGYGGPHAAFFATKDEYKRAVAGRIIGVSKDKHGNTALRMALQTREQHIRRDKATSNICTAQVLLAIIAGFYALYHGAEGLRLIAGRVHRYTQILAAGISQLGYQVLTECYFDTIQIYTPNRAKLILSRADEANINLRFIDANHIGISLDETTTRQEIRAVWRAFATSTNEMPNINALDKQLNECIPKHL
ncbi:partial glycine dehydrogenase, partial [uncultured bacterium]